MTGPGSSPRDGFDLLEFPCEYVFKSVGRTEPGYEIDLRRKVLEVIAESKLVRASSIPSRNGKYTSMTMVISLDNRQELETVYRVLSSHPDTVMTL